MNGMRDGLNLEILIILHKQYLSEDKSKEFFSNN